MANHETTPPPSSATQARFAGPRETEMMAGRGPRPNPSFARVGASLILAMAVIQTILAAVFLAMGKNGHEVREWHGVLGMITVIVCALGALFAFLSSRHGGRVYPFYLALALTVLSVIQVGLGEAHAKMVHMSIGVLFLLGAAWLAGYVFTTGRKTPTA